MAQNQKPILKLTSRGLTPIPIKFTSFDMDTLKAIHQTDWYGSKQFQYYFDP